ncbi:MAG: hypothetical protein LAO77_00865 [Acidobacteriia bacterium]|nr:hypothetical protein [Terriglobia bacterium]
MAQDLAKLFADVEAQWSTKKGLLLVLATVAALLIWLFTSVDLSKISTGQWILFVASMAVVVGLWWFTALPRILWHGSANLSKVQRDSGTRFILWSSTRD